MILRAGPKAAQALKILRGFLIMFSQSLSYVVSSHLGSTPSSSHGIQQDTRDNNDYSGLWGLQSTGHTWNSSSLRSYHLQYS